MKTRSLVPLLFLLSLPVLAQNVSLREATDAEKEAILGSAKNKLETFGEGMATRSETKLMEEGFLAQAAQGQSISDEALELYVQKMRSVYTKSADLKHALDQFVDQYTVQQKLSLKEEVLTSNTKSDLKAELDSIQKDVKDGILTEADANVKGLKLMNEAIKNAPGYSKVMDQVSHVKTKLQDLSSSLASIGPVKVDLKATDFSVKVPQNFSLNTPKAAKKPKIEQVYIAWGYNRCFHTNSDVKFTTPEGTFTVYNTKGNDRPTPYSFDAYVKNVTIPQYNIEIGVRFNEKWGMELQQNHMKLVFDNTRPYQMSGSYKRPLIIKNADGSFRKVSFDEALALNNATWLQYEHTDGYNYVALSAVYNQNLLHTKNKMFSLDARFGASAGLMIPRTEVHIHENEFENYRGMNNAFHVAGGGVGADMRLKATFWDVFFIQAVTRGTYIKVKNALVDGSDARFEHIQPIASVQFVGQVGLQKTIGNKKKK